MGLGWKKGTQNYTLNQAMLQAGGYDRGWYVSGELEVEIVESITTITGFTPCTTTDLSDWRAWRGNPEPGFCVCGVLKERCEYHK